MHTSKVQCFFFLFSWWIAIRARYGFNNTAPQTQAFTNFIQDEILSDSRLIRPSKLIKAPHSRQSCLRPVLSRRWEWQVQTSECFPSPDSLTTSPSASHFALIMLMASHVLLAAIYCINSKIWKRLYENRILARSLFARSWKMAANWTLEESNSIRLSSFLTIVTFSYILFLLCGAWRATAACRVFIEVVILTKWRLVPVLLSDESSKSNPWNLGRHLQPCGSYVFVTWPGLHWSAA